MAVALTRLNRDQSLAPLSWKTTPPVTAANLYDYQRRGVTWLCQRMTESGAALLADDMGLGKTAQALEVAKQLKCDRILIVAPKSVTLTWRKQVQKWCGADPYLAKTGKHCEDPRVLTEKFVVVSYDLAGRLNVDYNPDIMLLDEAHMFRGRASKRFKRVSEMAALCQYRLGITGTPMWDRPRDFYSLLHVLFRNRFGNSYAFDFAYCGAVSGTHGGLVTKGATNSDELKLRLSFSMLRREKKEVAQQLPELRRDIIWLEGDKESENALRRVMLKTKGYTVADALMACGDYKVEAACERAADARRFLVLTWTRRHAHEIHKRLIEKYDTESIVITGEMSVKQREAAVLTAAKNKIGVVATIDSTGQGVDGLQHVADVGIFHTLDWTPLKLLQAEARLHRIGQNNGVQWQYLAVKNSMDEFVVSTVVEKLDQWRGIMGQHSNRNVRDGFAASKDVDASVTKALYEAMASEGDYGD
jgi:SWI/SNF-related matrix-associated actin-dependent regulator 1 of chromatin subfamily A